MPYYHEGVFIDKDSFQECGGQILFWQRRCIKCGHKWPFKVLYSTRVPWDMSPFKVGERDPKKYAKWAENLPGVPEFASILPIWPRWARILSFSIMLLLAAWFVYFPIHFIWNIGPWFR